MLRDKLNKILASVDCHKNKWYLIYLHRYKVTIVLIRESQKYSLTLVLILKTLPFNITFQKLTFSESRNAHNVPVSIISNCDDFGPIWGSVSCCGSCFNRIFILVGP